MTNMIMKDFINRICSGLTEYNSISPETYAQFNVKRGLRNQDGTGVVAGVTMIGNVHGYVINEGERVPAPGKLFYRGLDVEKLIDGYVAEKRFGFEEVIYLLLFGVLPTAQQLDALNHVLAEFRALPRYFTEDMIMKAPSRDIMNKLGRSVLAMYSYDDNPDDLSIENLLRQSLELIARFPTIVAHAYQVKRHEYDNKSLYIHNPKPELNTAQNFLRVIRPDKEFTDAEARLLDLCLVLHAEHGGGNNSAFVCRAVSSTGTDTYSAISAAVGALKGPKHGGANIKVMEMMDEIMSNVANWTDEGAVADYLKKIMRKEAGDGSGLIYGMGHAVYTVSDPRAVILKKDARALAQQNGFADELALYELVEKLAPELVVTARSGSKIVSANVDMYSGLVYKMLGIPKELFTPLFAISRIVGWSAHRIEEVMTGGRIIRPAYKAIMQERDYTAMKDRA